MELNENEPLMTYRNNKDEDKTDVGKGCQDNCNGWLSIGYKSSGIQVARTLHRRLYET